MKKKIYLLFFVFIAVCLYGRESFVVVEFERPRPRIANVALSPSVDSSADFGSSSGFVDSAHIANEGWPKRVVQTWKTFDDLPMDVRECSEQWQRLNPEYEYELFDDEGLENFMMSNEPRLQEAFQAMRPVQRADLFRYLFVLYRGGVYADVDVRPVRPVRDWVSQLSSNRSAFAAGKQPVNCVVGFEKLTKRPDWRQHFSRQHQMCQWTFACRPRHPVFRYAVDGVLAAFESAKRDGVPYQSLNVITTTGPAIFTDAVAQFLREQANLTFGQPPLTMAFLERRPFVVSDLLVGPPRVFGTGSAGDMELHGGSVDDILVRHQFAGTWKKTGK